MTDLTLAQFDSLSKQELSRRLKQEKLQMHGSCSVRLVAAPPGSLTGRLRRSISSGLRIPAALQRKFFRNFA
ncbi:MAG: hypothetical protein ACM34H_06735 [Deltaproteobacteria bacterium]